MKYFYYTRHGQTIWNVENKICGVSDVSLTEKGINQAREQGNKILYENIPDFLQIVFFGRAFPLF